MPKYPLENPSLIPGAISQVFPKTEATSWTACCLEEGRPRTGEGKHYVSALSLLTHSLQLDSLDFGPQLSQLHLICLDDLTTSEAIFTSISQDSDS